MNTEKECAMVKYGKSTGRVEWFRKGDHPGFTEETRKTDHYDKDIMCKGKSMRRCWRVG